MAHTEDCKQKISGFSERLNIVLDNKKIKDKNKYLAEITKRSKASATGWLNYDCAPSSSDLSSICIKLSCSSDYLLGLNTDTRKRHATEDLKIQWSISEPSWLEGDQNTEINRGIALFEAFVLHNGSAHDVLRKSHISVEDAALAVQAAFRSGVLRFMHVEIDENLGDKLADKFDLRRVIVADLPTFFDGNIIRAEIVAFLAATRALQKVEITNVIGIGSGYTILRMAEQSVPSYTQFSDTEWLPLMAFQGDNLHSISARSIALLMAQRHPGSHALDLPYVSEFMSEENKKVLHEFAEKKYREAYSFFITVSGEGREKNRTGHKTELNYKFPVTDAVDVTSLYKKIREEDGFTGEVLGLMLNKQGQMIDRISKENKEFVYPSSPDLLRDIVTSGYRTFAWAVAARKYKAKAVHMAIETGLVNALVIDSEIAEYLDDIKI